MPFFTVFCKVFYPSNFITYHSWLHLMVDFSGFPNLIKVQWKLGIKQRRKGAW